MKSIILLILISLLQVVNASDVKLARLWNQNESFELVLKTGENDQAKEFKLFDNQLKTWSKFSIANLKSGVVLKQEGKHKVIILKSNDFENDRGGNFTLDYLNSGVSGKRKTTNIELSFSGHEWAIYKAGEKMNIIKVKVKKLFTGAVIGIEKFLFGFDPNYL